MFSTTRSQVAFQQGRRRFELERNPTVFDREVNLPCGMVIHLAVHGDTTLYKDALLRHMCFSEI